MEKQMFRDNKANMYQQNIPGIIFFYSTMPQLPDGPLIMASGMVHSREMGRRRNGAFPQSVHSSVEVGWGVGASEDECDQCNESAN